jgi:hypothetical protein
MKVASTKVTNPEWKALLDKGKIKVMAETFPLNHAYMISETIILVDRI